MTQHTNPAQTALFTLKSVTKVYQMGQVEVVALQGIDLTLYHGEFVVILGASGSGKSTLLNILGGLDSPTTGQVWYGLQNLAAAGQPQLTDYRRFDVGFVFQFYNLIPSLTALENVAVVTEIAHNPMPPQDALAKVGLSHRLNHFPAQLSGGEQQRVALARALAKNPKVLLCDEPTGALDSHTGVQVLEALQGINKTLSTTTIIITHNVSMAQMADRVIHMADGQITHIAVNATRVAAQQIRW
ncbi:ABC transporter ATP-binding protein [Thiomicrorhabdus aquaedulcis]|uniref:ABC transporter ATP-binding protein n=1 Tax=Thiomicrorhabdus aquaedulcis TaxID=2211106 RepID=UPI000FDA43CE|nr:ABC transporter ATP-binding protein [Thiomicrorhabdus aquaedulcis]